jgi:hypothetical protein
MNVYGGVEVYLHTFLSSVSGKLYSTETFSVVFRGSQSRSRVIHPVA